MKKKTKSVRERKSRGRFKSRRKAITLANTEIKVINFLHFMFSKDGVYLRLWEYNLKTIFETFFVLKNLHIFKFKIISNGFLLFKTHLTISASCFPTNSKVNYSLPKSFEQRIQDFSFFIFFLIFFFDF